MKLLTVLSFIITFISINAHASRINKDMNWNEILESNKVSLIGDRVSYGDRLGRKVSAFNICRTNKGKLKTITEVEICHDSRLIERGRRICTSSEVKRVEFSDRFARYECASPRCGERRRVEYSLGKEINLAVYAKGHPRQGPYGEFLFNKSLKFPSCK